MRTTASRWYAEFPELCPGCGNVAVGSEKARWWARYQCCKCFTEFARFPRTLAWVMPVRTGVCRCLASDNHGRNTR